MDTREELNIRLDGKAIKQVDGFVYLGGMVTEDGHSVAEVRRRTQAGGQKRVDRRRMNDLKKEVGMQCSRKIGEKQDEMGRPLRKNGCKQTSKQSRGGKHQGR